jgi:hypothetical protein
MTTKFSYNDEEAIIAELFGPGRLPLRHEFCVDIGAGDGLTMSNTHFLYAGGWRGLAVEYNPLSFARLAQVYANAPKVELAKCRATPEGIAGLLAAFGVPRDFDLLSLDIDGYDHAVLDAILADYRPALICTEINETFPPPVRFVVRYDPNLTWSEGRFFGQSLSSANDLCARRDYALVRLEYNNAFFVPRELLASAGLSAAEPAVAFREGYVNGPDRHKRYPWNAELDYLRDLPPEKVVEWAERHFEQYRGRFDCRV